MAALAVPTSDRWEQALLELKATNDLSFDIGRTDRRVVLEEVLSALLQREQLSQQRRWKWKNRKGETVIIRDMLAKMVRWINKFKEIGDSIMQYDTAHAALPWAAVRLVLQVAVNDEQIQGSIAEGLELVFLLIARYEIVETILLDGSSKAQMQLSDSIVKLYTAILFYLSEIHRYYARSTPQRLALSVIRTAESASQEWIDKIKNAESQVHLNSQVLYYESMKSTSSDVLSIHATLQQLSPVPGRLGVLETGIKDMSVQVPELGRRVERLQIILSELGRPISRIASALSALEDSLDEKERVRIFDWLTDARYTSHQKEKAKNLLRGSCQWLLNKPKFLDWQTSSTSSILWLHGIPGSGKSMLVAAVIEYLQKRNEEVEHSAPMGFFYCAKMNEPERADPTVILRTILEQLSSTNQHCPIRKPVCQKYISARTESRGRPPEKLDLDETIDIILELLKDNPATIILDGLDECDPQKRQGLLNGLQKIIKESENIVKVFVSSRDDHDLVHRLAETPNLYINAADNRNDIESFVQTRVSEAIEDERILCGQVSPDLRKLIVGTLIRKAQGMFRLVSLHIETLCNPQHIKTEENVRVALQRLPKDLSKSYSIILEQIRRSEKPNPQIAENTIRWLLCAAKSMPSRAFIQAVCVDIGGKTVISCSEILSVCANLVIYDAESDVFRFAHLSVQEYIENLADYGVDRNNARAAEQCISYLLENNPLQDEVEPSLTFSDYCIGSWGTHVEKAADRRKEGEFPHSLRKMLSRISIHYFGTYPNTRIDYSGTWPATWPVSYQPLRKTLPELWYCENSSVNVLFVACVLGLSEIVEEILSDLGWAAVNLENRNSQGYNCASLAALFDQSHLIPILFNASQTAQLSDEYWHEVIRITTSLRIAASTFNTVRSQFTVLQQILDCCRHDFIAEKDLAMVLKNGSFLEEHYWKMKIKESELNGLFSSLFSRCNEVKILGAIIRFGGIPYFMQDTECWFSLPKLDGVPTYEGLARKTPFKTISQQLIYTYGIVGAPYVTKLVRILLQQPRATITEDSLRIFIYSFRTITTQMLLMRNHLLAEISTMVHKMLPSSDREFRYLLYNLVIEKLGPIAEHTAMILSVGDVDDVERLLSNAPIVITSQVIEMVARNRKHGEAIMKLLLAHEPETNNPDDFLRVAESRAICKYNKVACLGADCGRVWPWLPCLKTRAFTKSRKTLAIKED